LSSDSGKASLKELADQIRALDLSTIKGYYDFILLRPEIVERLEALTAESAYRDTALNYAFKIMDDRLTELRKIMADPKSKLSTLDIIYGEGQIDGIEFWCLKRLEAARPSSEATEKDDTPDFLRKAGFVEIEPHSWINPEWEAKINAQRQKKSVIDNKKDDE
jgi:hypothetical protein